MTWRGLSPYNPRAPDEQGAAAEMFADAYETARKFMRPIVVSSRKMSGETFSSIGAYVFINKDGWVLTASHIMREVEKLNASKKLYSIYLEESEALKQNQKINAKQKARRLKKMKVKATNLVTNYSLWWGIDGAVVEGISARDDIDLAAGRLKNVGPSLIDTVPRIKDPTKSMKPGRSLCRLGFPFHSINPIFDEKTQVFRFPGDDLPLPVFPIEGIYTRNIVFKDEISGRPVGMLLETSSPGLAGQSGGPVVDRKGTLWSIQSHTFHQPLGFSPVANKRAEPQFLNLGRGAHPRSIVDFLTQAGVEFQMSDY